MMNLGAVVIFFVIVLISMTLHEMAHAYVAYFLGDTTAKEEGRLSLNPVKHIDPVMSLAVPVLLYMTGGVIFGGAKPVPINSSRLKWGEWGMALVAIAGPLTNLVLAFIVFLFGYFTNLMYDGGFGQLVCTNFVFANLGFFAFNMLPVPPLDGSRILYAIAPDGVRRVMQQMEGTTGLVVVMFLVVFCGVWLSKITASVINGLLAFFYWIVQ